MASNTPRPDDEGAPQRRANSTGSRTALGAKDRRRVGWRLNGRLLLRTAVLLAIAAPAAYFWHEMQLDRVADAMVVRADLHVEAGEWREAANAFDRYLRLRPEDEEARRKQAIAYQSAAVSPGQKVRAIQLLNVVDPNGTDVDLQQRIADLNYELGNHAEAHNIAVRLLETAPNSAEAWRIKALASHGLVRSAAGASTVTLDQAIENFRRAIELAPGNGELAFALAIVYRVDSKHGAQTERDGLADQAMDRLIAAAPESGDAYYYRYRYRRGFDIAGAEEDLAAALQHPAADLHAAIRLSAAQAAWQKQDWAKAEAFAREAHQAAPLATPPLHLLGGALLAQDKLDEAAKELEQGLERIALFDRPIVLGLLGQAHIRNRQWNAVESDIDQVANLVARAPGAARTAAVVELSALQAEAKIARSQPAQAVAPLRRFIDQFDERSLGDARPRYGAAWYRLAQCYLAIGQPDRAAPAFQKTAELQAGGPNARLLAAYAFASAGREEESVRQFEIASEEDDFPQEAWRAYLRSLFARTKRRGDDNWAEYDRVLGLASAKFPSDPFLILASVNASISRGRVEAAVAELKSIEPLAETDVKLAEAAAPYFRRLEMPESADKLAAAVRAAAAGTVKGVLLDAAQLAADDKIDEACALLEKTIPTRTPPEQAELHVRLAGYRLATDKLDEARQGLEAAAALAENNLNLATILAELALRTNDFERAKKWEGDLLRIEGETAGVAWRAVRAQRLLREAKLQTKPQAILAAVSKARRDAASVPESVLAEPRRLQREIESLRPEWPWGHLLEALLAQLGPEPDLDAAIAAFQRSIHLGGNSLEAYEALTVLLWGAGRDAEALIYTDRLRAADALSPLLELASIELDLGRGDVDRAVDTARRAQQKAPTDPQRLLYLGLLLIKDASTNEAERQKRHAEGEGCLQQARKLDPKLMPASFALLRYYRATDRLDDARQVLAEIAALPDQKPGEKSFNLAQGNLQLGDAEKAAELYREAVEQAGDNVNVLLAAASFFVARRDLDLAGKYLAKAADLTPLDDRVALLKASLALASAKSVTDLQAVESALENNGQALDIDGAMDDRLRARAYLFRRGREMRGKAIDMLEAIVADRRQALPEDRLLLASVYDQEGRAGDARRVLEPLVRAPAPGADHLAVYAALLLKGQQTEEAAAWLDKLAAIEPEASSGRTLLLRATWLKQRGESEKLEPLVEQFVESARKQAGDKANEVQLSLVRAQLFDQAGLSLRAEQALRDAYARDATKFPQLALWLAAHDRQAEALAICEAESKPQAALAPAIIASGIVAATPSLPADLKQKAEKTIAFAFEKQPDSAPLHAAVGTQRLLEGNRAEAIRLLRRTIELDPRNAAAMNNLALVLAEDPDSREEALELMDRAIELSGKAAELLDSRGWVLLKSDRYAEAVADFVDALSLPPGSAKHHFHLAVAYFSDGKPAQARKALSAARNAKLDEKILSEDERRYLQRLDSELPSSDLPSNDKERESP